MDGRKLSASYRRPWLREFFRALGTGGTLEFDPVDFLERVMDIVSFHRPQWVAGLPAEAE